MDTYIDLFLAVDGAKASEIHKKLVGLGLKATIGNHDFVYVWKGLVSMEEELTFIDKVQLQLKGTGAILKFSSTR